MTKMYGSLIIHNYQRRASSMEMKQHVTYLRNNTDNDYQFVFPYTWAVMVFAFLSVSTGDREQPGGSQAADSWRRPAAPGPQSVRQGLHEGLPHQSGRLHTAGPAASLLQGRCSSVVYIIYYREQLHVLAL